MTTLQLNMGARTERGARAFNNDAFTYWPQESLLLTSHCCAAIADGVGPARSAGEAARLVTKTAVQHCAEEGGTTSPRTVLQQAFAFSQQQLKLSYPHALSTLTLIMTRDDQLWLAHTGDTRLYRWRNNQLECLTTDHRSVSAEMGGGLLRAVGLDASVLPDISRHHIQRHDRYMLLTDGIYDVLSSQQLHHVISQSDDAQGIADQLVNDAIRQGSQDNASALIVDVVDVNQQLHVDVLDAVAQLPLVMVNEIAAVIDDYRINEVIAKTRLHTVCLASDLRRHENVVLKFANLDSQTELQACATLLHEMKLGLQLRHPQWVLAKSPDLTRQSALYVVYPFVAGNPLTSRDIKRYGLRQLLRFGVELAELLQFLHQQHYVHADIKPENILRGGDGKLYLIDFGLTHHVSEFQINDPVGTPNFMAPELWQSLSPTAASDQFALASTLYHLASGGEAPYGDNEVFSKPSFKRYRRLREWRDDLPLWFDIVLERALQREPDDRYRDCHALADALRDGMQHGAGLTVSTRRPSLLEQNPLRFYQSLSALLALFSCLLLFLLLH